MSGPFASMASMERFEAMRDARYGAGGGMSYPVQPPAILSPRDIIAGSRARLARAEADLDAASATCRLSDRHRAWFRDAWRERRAARAAWSRTWLEFCVVASAPRAMGRAA